jgi:hypothetical protein
MEPLQLSAELHCLSQLLEGFRRSVVQFVVHIRVAHGTCQEPCAVPMPCMEFETPLSGHILVL